MVLKLNRAWAMLPYGILRDPDIKCRASQADIVLDQNAILKHSNPWWSKEGRGITCKPRCSENYIIRLPLPRSSAHIYQRCILLVKAAGLTIPVCSVIVAVEHLHFVKALQVYSAVSPSLAFTGNLRRGFPFNMQLKIIEISFRLDHS